MIMENKLKTINHLGISYGDTDGEGVGIDWGADKERVPGLDNNHQIRAAV